MSAYNTHQEIVKRLGELSNKLSSGELSETELKEFETLSRDLYERAVVLHYKAKESKVYSKNGNTKKEEPAQAIKKEEVAENPPKKTEDSKPPSKQENNLTEEIAFDFSGDDDEPVIPKREEQKKPVSETDNTKTSTVQKEEAEEKTVKTEEQTTQKINDPKINSFFERFTEVHDDSLMSKLGSSKINSLKGAIGLNDKLQFISELFAGNSELFNKAIDILDEQENNEKARYQLSEIAAEQGWDAESPLVEEFVKIIDRRYAD